MGNDRMDSRLAEGFRKIPEMWTAPSFCSATAGLLPGGTDTQRSGELLKHSRAAYYNKKACIPPLPPPPPQPRTSLVKQGQGPVSRAQVCVLRSSRKPEDDTTFQEGGSSFLPPPRAATRRLRGGRAGRSSRPGPQVPRAAEAAPGHRPAAGRGGRTRTHAQRCLRRAGRAAAGAWASPSRRARREGGSEGGRTDRPAGGRGEPPPTGCAAT